VLSLSPSSRKRGTKEVSDFHETSPHDPGRYSAGTVENGIAGQYQFAGRSCAKARIYFNSGKRDRPASEPGNDVSPTEKSGFWILNGKKKYNEEKTKGL
jgi:hypothetical protein